MCARSQPKWESRFANIIQIMTYIAKENVNFLVISKYDSAVAANSASALSDIKAGVLIMDRIDNYRF